MQYRQISKSVLPRLLLGVFLLLGAQARSTNHLSGLQQPSRELLQNSGDDRVLVQDTTQFPYSAVGLLKLEFPNTYSTWCSAALIAPATVLTAAHCIVDFDPNSGNGTISSANFSPGYNPYDTVQPAPFGTANVISYYVNPAYLGCSNHTYSDGSCLQANDFAVVKLDTEFVAAMPFQFYADPTDSGDRVVEAAGYPGDHPGCSSKNDEVGCAMVKADCTDQSFTDVSQIDDFGCFTFPGFSGSPVYETNSVTGQSVIRGIVSSYANAADSEANRPGPGVFTIITEDVFNLVEYWVAT